jgi:hypothetical protein
MKPKDNIRMRHKAFWKKQNRLFSGHEKECNRIYTEWEMQPSAYPLPKYPPPPLLPIPPEIIGLTCGAKTRAGTPCKLTSLYENGRCKFHGGASTGPRTLEGKMRSAMNGFKPKHYRLHGDLR